jgi:putative transposase
MRKPIPLRPDYDAAALRRLARESDDADHVRRLLALAVIYDGGSRTQAAEVGGVTLQVVRDWALRFNAEGPAGLIDRKAPGARPRLNDEHRAALAAMVENGPIPAVHGVIRCQSALNIGFSRKLCAVAASYGIQ